ncbi:hypothetical protein LAZ67_2005415 [Cordylochernes scorpioides]|uniref:Transposase n=1 Tax=Cordylochernes scorpioides TaxID=51811 RepID=A0ABY6K4D0_9ARAC|nr:hypothetical protein LAZ67_2005415 [Cordylochernes scorpioides]
MILGKNAQNVQKITDLIKENPRTTLLELEQDTGISKTTIGRIVTKDLKLKKTPAKFIPRFLTNEQKLCRLATCENMLEITRTDPEWKDKIITGDETWVYDYDPETKRQYAEWRGQGEPRPKKSRILKSRKSKPDVECTGQSWSWVRDGIPALGQQETEAGLDGSERGQETGNHQKCRQFFVRKECRRIVNRFVALDETWAHHFTPESKQQSMQWRHSGSPPPKKAKAVPSAGKVMVSVFWDSEGVLLLDFLNKGQTITGNYYAKLMTQLREAIREKRIGKLSRKIVYHQDNAPSHLLLQAMAAIYDSGFEPLPHAPYSPDLAPADFHLFPHLKKSLSVIHFWSDEEVIDAVTSFFESLETSFFLEGIKALEHRWKKCIDLKGDYVEELESLHIELVALNEQCQLVLLAKENITDEEIDREYEDWEKYIQERFNMEQKIELELKTYDGSLENWLPWWTQFSKAILPDSQAYRVIASYPVTGDNYISAIKALQVRFGDPNILTELYVRQLLNLVMANVRKKNSNLSNLYDDLSSHLRSLQTLGIDPQLSGIFLYPLVESSLPSDVLKIWQRHPSSGYRQERGRERVPQRKFYNGKPRK